MGSLKIDFDRLPRLNDSIPAEIIPAHQVIDFDFVVLGNAPQGVATSNGVLDGSASRSGNDRSGAVKQSQVLADAQFVRVRNIVPFL